MSWIRQESMEDRNIKVDFKAKHEPLENVEPEETRQQEIEDSDWKTFEHNRKEFKFEAESESHSQVLQQIEIHKLGPKQISCVKTFMHLQKNVGRFPGTFFSFF